MSAHILQCVWPIIDDSRTRNELIAEAKADLDKLADQAHANITGPPVWYIADAADTPGWTGYAPGMVLVANLPAEPYGQLWEHRVGARVVDSVVVDRIVHADPPAKVSQAERTAAMVALAKRETHAEVAARFGVNPDAVQRAVVRYGKRTKELVAA